MRTLIRSDVHGISVLVLSEIQTAEVLLLLFPYEIDGAVDVIQERFRRPEYIDQARGQVP